MMRYVSHVTSMIRHGHLRKGDSNDQKAVDELRTNYQTLKAGLKTYEDYMDTLKPIDKDLRTIAFDAHTYHLVERFYSFGLTVGVILACVLSAFDTEDKGLISDMNSFANGIMALAHHARLFKPLGASYMQLCFQAAWVGTTDPLVRAEAEKEMAEYLADFGTGYTIEQLVPEMEKISRHLRLIDPYTM